MARTKNRGYQQTLTPTYTARLWKMGGYIRLSREDLQKINRGLDDSNSVKNQRNILNVFQFFNPMQQQLMFLRSEKLLFVYGRILFDPTVDRAFRYSIFGA